MRSLKWKLDGACVVHQTTLHPVFLLLLNLYPPGAYAAKGYFFQAALCLMASGDNVAAGSKLQSFKQADFNFPSSRECLFLEQLLEVSTVHLSLTVPATCGVDVRLNSHSF